MSFDLNTILVGIFFGLVGFSAWRYGKNAASGRHMLLGAGLMGYAYFVTNIWASLAIGCALTVFLFWP
jgi:hypothetical protein